MNKTLLVGALILPLVVLGTRVAFLRAPQAEQGLRSGTFDPPREAPAFRLDGSNGSKLSPRDYLGKVVIVEFGYTNCQDVCPTTLAHLTQAWKKMGKASGDVQLIYITVDPARDNPERLREHLTAFNPSFLGATGTAEELQSVEAYGVVAKQVPSKIRHSRTRWIIRRLFTWSTGRENSARWCPSVLPVDDIVHDLEYLLKTAA